MKSNFPDLHEIKTDQQQKLPQPPLEKPYDESKKLIKLIAVEDIQLKQNDLSQCIKSRKSVRNFSTKPITFEELSFLLWASQGVRDVFIRNDHAYATFRTVPSGGARHPFETYLSVHNVEGLKPGIYRYIATKHSLIFEHDVENLKEKITAANLGQSFAGDAGVVFIWSTVAYRGEWRYSFSSHKIMLLDCGHVCQNLYLACEALELGTCAIGAYDQQLIDALLNIDGNDEFSTYIAPVGHK